MDILKLHGINQRNLTYDEEYKPQYTRKYIQLTIDNYKSMQITEEQEILLSFKSDDKGRLTQLNFVADCDFYEYEKTTLFLENSLYAFINNDDLTINILSESNLFNNLSTKTKNTLKTKNGNIELLLDVTEIGTVITVYKDI